MLNLSHNPLIVDPKSQANTSEAQAIKNDKMGKYDKMSKDEKALRNQLHYNNVFTDTKRAEMKGRSQSSNSNRSARSVASANANTISIQLLDSVKATSSMAQENVVQTSFAAKNGRFLALTRDESNESLKSAHSESRRSYREDVNEKKAKRIHEANKHVTDSSQLN